MLTMRREAARRFGQESERLAERYLRRQGYAILERNARVAGGEIDLVARHGSTLVFVEVKARRTSAMGGALAAVHAGKCLRLIRAVGQYLALHQVADQPCRIDVVVIQHQADGQVAIQHIENAVEQRDGVHGW